MYKRLLGMGVLVVFLGGGTCLRPATCETDADCGNGNQCREDHYCGPQEASASDGGNNASSSSEASSQGGSSSHGVSSAHGVSSSHAVSSSVGVSSSRGASSASSAGTSAPVSSGVSSSSQMGGSSSAVASSSGPVTRCGDGMVNQASEQCDDGNMVETDGCLSTCVICGDHLVAPTGEQCDDGNADDHDACTNSCANARCGDGLLQYGVEDCDDGNTADGDGCPMDCKLPVARFVYLVSPSDGTVNVYSLADGAGLQARGYQYVGLDAGPIAAHPSGRFVYVFSRTGIHTFQVDPAGTPTHGRLREPGQPVAAAGVVDLVMDPLGSFLFVLRASGVTAYQVNQVNGALVEAHTSAGAYEAAAPNWVGTAVAAVASDGTVSLLTVDRTTGALQATGTPQSTGAGPHILQFDRTGRLLFVLSTGAATVKIYHVTAAGLALAASNPMPASTSSMAVVGDAALVLTSTGAAGSLQSWRLDRTVGALLPATSGLTGSFVIGRLVPAENSAVVLGLSPNTEQLLVLQPDLSTGAVHLLRAGGMRGGYAYAAMVHGAHALVVQPGFALVANATAHTLASFAVSSVDGTLAPAAASQVTGVDTVTLDVTQGRAYARKQSPQGIRVFSINATNGQLTAAPSDGSSTNALNPVVYDGSGRFLYGLDQTAKTIARYAVDQTTLSPAFVESTPSGATTPDRMLMDPVGRRLLVTETEWPSGAPQLVPHTVEVTAQTGATGPRFTWAVTITDPCLMETLAVNPSGLGALAAASNCTAVWPFALSPSPVFVVGPFDQGYRDSVVVHPQGHLVALSLEYGGQDPIFRLETWDLGLNGLASSRDVGLGGRPDCMTVDPSGNFLYLVQGGMLQCFKLGNTPVRYEPTWSTAWPAGAACPQVTAILQ